MSDMDLAHSYSVVVPLFNKEGTIDRTIDSILSQGHDVEIIVVNDGSTDEGPERVAERDDSRIKLLHQANKGISAARNKGIEHATNEFIGLLDADDEYLPNFLDLIDEMVEAYPSAGAFTTSFRYVFPDRSYDSVHPMIKRPFMGTPDYFLLAGFDKYFCASSIVLRRSAVKDIGGFRPWGYGEDVDAWGRMALRYPMAHRSDIGARYIRCSKEHPSMTHGFTLEPCIRFALEALNGDANVPRESLRSYVNNHLCEHARLCVIDGRRREARETLARRRGNEMIRRMIILHMLSYCPAILIDALRRARGCLMAKRGR